MLVMIAILWLVLMEIYRILLAESSFAFFGLSYGVVALLLLLFSALVVWMQGQGYFRARR